MSISITVDKNDIPRLRDKIENIQPALKAIGFYFKENINVGFKAQQDPWGNKWKELSDFTIERRRKGPRPEEPDRILRDTGNLANKFTYKVSNNTLAVGTDVEYAGTHQFGAIKGIFGKTKKGGPIPWANIPSRPMLPFHNNAVDLPTSWREEIVKAFSKHFNG